MTKFNAEEYWRVNVWFVDEDFQPSQRLFGYSLSELHWRSRCVVGKCTTHAIEKYGESSKEFNLWMNVMRVKIEIAKRFTHPEDWIIDFFVHSFKDQQR